MIEPFLARAALAAAGLAIIAAPLGCFVVWNRMSYFGETIAQASLLGVALALLLDSDLNVTVIAVTALIALAIVALSRQSIVPVDSVLGLLHHGTLALGVIAIASLKGQSVDLLGYLFGDIFAISPSDLWWIAGIGVAVLAVMLRLWQPMLRMAVHDDLARAEGLSTLAVRTIFTAMLAVVIALAIKIVGILLAIAFLIVPAVASRPFSRTPEQMIVLSAAVGGLAALLGLMLSVQTDVPGGPAIVVVMTAAAASSLVWSGLRGKP